MYGFHACQACSPPVTSRTASTNWSQVWRCRRQHALTCWRQSIEAAPALARLLDPRPLDPAALFEAIEQRIEQVEVKHQPPARPRFDQLAELIAVPGSGLQHGQQEQFGGALLQLAVEGAARSMSVISRY